LTSKYSEFLTLPPLHSSQKIQSQVSDIPVPEFRADCPSSHLHSVLSIVPGSQMNKVFEDFFLLCRNGA
jgi:hypothetical protein